MPTFLPIEFAVLGVLFVLNALISASEIAMASLSRAKMSELSERHPSWSNALLLWRDHPSQLLTTILVCSNICVIGLSSVTTVIGLDLNRQLAWPDWGVAAATMTVSVLVVLLSEIAPKVLAKRHPEQVATFSIPMLRVLETLLGPIIRQLVKLIRWLTRPFGGEEGESLPTVTEEELVHLVDESVEAGTLDKEESEMIQSVIEFGDTLVREVMIPRTQLDGVSGKSTVEQCLDKFIDTGYTRLPVFNGDMDHIVGMLYAKDFLAVLKERELIILQDVIRPAFFVPESKKVTELLREFRKGRIHMAVVVDEYGGTAGIVTLEDLVEEIIGEIRDEYDTESGPVRPRGADQWEVEAEFSLHDFGAEIGVEFPEEGEASSVGGFVAEHLGRIPARGAKLIWRELQFEVLDSSEKRVKRVLVKRLPTVTEAE
jgi:CBS domain containing-hemolysin-like protein